MIFRNGKTGTREAADFTASAQMKPGMAKG